MSNAMVRIAHAIPDRPPLRLAVGQPERVGDQSSAWPEFVSSPRRRAQAGCRGDGHEHGLRPPMRSEEHRVTVSGVEAPGDLAQRRTNPARRRGKSCSRTPRTNSTSTSTSPDGVSSSAAPGWLRTSLTLRSRGQPRRRPGMLHVRHPSARTHRSPVLAELSRVLRVALAGQACSGSNPRSISEAKRRRSSSPIIPAASLSSRSPTISPSGCPPRVSNSFPMLAR